MNFYISSKKILASSRWEGEKEFFGKTGEIEKDMSKPKNVK